MRGTFLATASFLVAGCATKPPAHKAKAEEAALSPTVARARGELFDPVIGEVPNKPNGTFVLSNGQVGIGFIKANAAEDESSGWQTVWLQGQFSTQGTASLLRFANPLSLSLPESKNREEQFSFDYESGIYKGTWKQDGLAVSYEAVLVPNEPVVVERLTLSGGSPGRVVKVYHHPQEGFRRTSSTLRESQADNRHHAVFSAPSGKLDSQGQATFEQAHRFDGKAPATTFEVAANKSKVWASGPEAPRITIDGPVDDQLFINSALYNLRAGVSQSGPTGPFGLTNPKYGGRVFWDSDTWMFPALALLDPSRASSIPKFRLATRSAAEKAAFDWAVASREQFHPSVPPYKFPWEAGPTGTEQATGESRKQEHVTGDVAFCAGTAGALGLITEAEAKSLVEGCGQYFWHRATRLANGQWGVLDTMSPDEFHTGDNDLYTNILTEWTLRRAFPDRWNQMSFKRPKDDQGFLTYDNDPVKSYKQAAALLAVWPLQDPGCETEALKMLDRFAGKSVKNGPAMSASVEALVRARFGDKDVAYDEWRTSWKKYTTRPLMMFSESPNGKNAYFLTGAAGCLNTVLYGFVGLRIDSNRKPTAEWKIPLKDGYWISCRPALPKAWKSVTIDGLTILGKRYRLHATNKGVKVTPSGI